MKLLHATGIERSFGDRHILRDAHLGLSDGERVGLVGVNGSGKSTLMKILAGTLEADHGRIDRAGTFGLLHQIPTSPATRSETPCATRWAGTPPSSPTTKRRWPPRSRPGRRTAGAPRSRRLERGAQGRRDDEPPAHGTQGRRLVASVGGQPQRVALARVLLQQPDLLLLDEPTNHLDADTCEWLQGLLAGWRGGVLLVTHDRYLLEAVATRIVEVEDGVTVPYEGNYTDYLLARAERQARLEQAEEKRMALIRQEVAWASRSPAARSTKQKARLQRLDALQAQRPLPKGSDFRLNLKTGHRRGGPLLEARRLKMAYGDKVLLDDIDVVLRAGETVGILGPNSLETTLLRILAGRLQPDAGDIVKAPRLNGAVLDYTGRASTPSTVWEAAGDGNDHVFVGGEPVHVAGFLERFSFRRESFDQKVEKLPGESGRACSWRLVLHGANLLLLDEPTNDLDLLTLRILESALLDFDGAAVVVTHDRAFLDWVCDRVLASEATEPSWSTRAGCSTSPRSRPGSCRTGRAGARGCSRAAATPARAKEKKKLTYKEQQEFAALPGRIEVLEAELEQVEARLGDPSLYGGGNEAEVASLTEAVERPQGRSRPCTIAGRARSPGLASPHPRRVVRRCCPRGGGAAAESRDGARHRGAAAPRP